MARTRPGEVDPRPRAMAMALEPFDRIHAHGGVFVFFFGERRDGNYVGIETSKSGYRVRDEVSWHNQGCLTLLKGLGVQYDPGNEIHRPEAELDIPLLPHLVRGSFISTISPGWLDHRWVTLATNKFGDPVAGAIAPSKDKEGEGWVVVLPQVADQAAVVRELLDHMLPNLVPALFPHVEKGAWTRRAEYELPGIVDLRGEIAAVEEEARGKVRAFEESIEEERRRDGYLHDLVTGTGDELVTAVQTALEVLGFSDVRDVDAEEAHGSADRKREDPTDLG